MKFCQIIEQVSAVWIRTESARWLAVCWRSLAAEVRLVCPSQVEKCGARSTGKKPRGQTLNARQSTSWLRASGTLPPAAPPPEDELLVMFGYRSAQICPARV